MTHRIGGEEEVLATFNDALYWMLDEGLIRVANKSETLGGTLLLVGVQLTSKGIAVIQTKIDDPEIGESIERAATEAKGGLEPSHYTNIGSFVGGILGGFTKSISG